MDYKTNKLIQDIWLDLHQEMRKFILKKVNNIEDTEDILQEIFIKIQLNIHQLNDYTKLTSWSYQIARNIINDYFRNVRSTVDIEEVHLNEMESEESIYQSLSNCINQKIDKLPGKYKQAIVLTSFQQFAQKELAEKIGTSYSGAKSRVQRAKDQLRTSILSCRNLEADSNGNILHYQSDKII